MNKSFLLAGTLTLTAALASCGGTAPTRIYTLTDPPPRPLLQLAQPNPTNVNVFVTADNFIVIDQEPIHPPPANDPVVIYFSVATPGYVFPPDTVSPNMRGVYIKQPPLPGACTWQNATLFRCTYPHPTGHPIYHYGVNLVNTSGGAPPMALDPSIMN